MKYSRQRNHGFALLTVLLMSVIVLGLTGAMLYRITSTSRDLVRREKLDQTLNVSEAVVSQTVSWLSSQNYIPGIGVNPINSVDLVEKVYDTSTTVLQNAGNLNLSGNTTIKYPPDGFNLNTGSSVTSVNINTDNNNFLKSLMTTTTHSSTYLGSTVDGAKTIIQSLLGSVGSTSSTTATLTPEDLTKVLYTSRMINIGTGAKYKAEARISLIPVSTNANNMSETQMHGTTLVAHTDILKLRTKVCTPNCTTPEISRTIEVVMNRPVVVNGDYSFDDAMVSEGNIDLGSGGNTKSGPNQSGNSTHHGDVRSNGTITGGSIDGNAYSFLGRSAITSVIESSSITAAEIADGSNGKYALTERVTIPTFNQSTSTADLVNCNTLIGYPARIGNCYVNGNFSTSKDTVIFGEIHIKGSFDQGGNDDITPDPFSTGPIKIVVDGTITAHGTPAGTTRKVLFISLSTAANAVTFSGTADPVGLFVAPNGGINAGNGGPSVFGALISKTGITSNGHPLVKRDDGLGALSVFVLPSSDQCKMKIVLWKEIK